MILRENTAKVGKCDNHYALPVTDDVEFYKSAIYFDLEHYVNRKPICVGVFGCCYYDESTNELKVTQYMIENKKDSIEVLNLAAQYFKEIREKHNKKYIVTFAGNNDFTVIDYLFKKNKVEYNIHENFKEIDLQKEYEKVTKSCIGLKNLEKQFEINRESELISGQNLARTFKRIVKDSDYTRRMPDEKKEKILLYNEQDVISLFQICTNWKKYLEDKR
ncbi:ribonuclease H-like domain-containing protein [Haloimpatiens sp. FM7330]|uniref:ribonuclease H-like domain-containing protein n=1 Tax=Haloimpatiens sp. FM7330 TaxID=3298610 RepID=UPI00363FA9B2